MRSRLHRGVRGWVWAGFSFFLPAAAGEGETFCWGHDGGAHLIGPHAPPEPFLFLMDMSFSEPLIRRSREMKLEPGLATEWARVEPTVWRFKLRQGVKFHDGTPFTADDVVFSYDRATHPGSNVASPLATVKEVKKVDDLTVDLVTDGP